MEILTLADLGEVIMEWEAHRDTVESESSDQLLTQPQVAANNANLIAAAPDLYVALEDLADIIETLCQWLDVAHGVAGGAIAGAYREACAGSLDRAATALAKARGEEVALERILHEKAPVPGTPPPRASSPRCSIPWRPMRATL